MGREKPTPCTMNRWREGECVCAQAHNPRPTAHNPQYRPPSGPRARPGCDGARTHTFSLSPPIHRTWGWFLSTHSRVACSPVGRNNVMLCYVRPGGRDLHFLGTGRPDGVRSRTTRGRPPDTRRFPSGRRPSQVHRALASARSSGHVHTPNSSNGRPRRHFHAAAGVAAQGELH